jgi:hypothetical protein
VDWVKGRRRRFRKGMVVKDIRARRMVRMRVRGEIYSVPVGWKWRVIRLCGLIDRVKWVKEGVEGLWRR